MITIVSAALKCRQRQRFSSGARVSDQSPANIEIFASDWDDCVAWDCAIGVLPPSIKQTTLIRMFRSPL